MKNISSPSLFSLPIYLDQETGSKDTKMEMRSKYTKAQDLCGVKPWTYLFISAQSIRSLGIYFSQFYLILNT